jgi:radical SAM superfamily enzyme YgiQ (UPF0313 family)
MTLRHITFIRPTLGQGPSADAMTPLVFAVLRARTPPEIATTLIDERVEPFAPVPTDLVAITVEAFTTRRAYEIAAIYRARGVPVVMGGHQPTALPDEAARHADCIVIGDAEGQWEQLVEDARNGILKKRYDKKFARARNDPLRFDRSIFAGKKYVPVSLVQVGTGCRYACEFCSIHAFYGSHREQRRVDDVVAELQTLPRNRLVFFVDDNLLWKKDRFIALMNALRPLNMMWSCQISIDVARDERLLDLMAEAGCRLVLIGLETLNRDTLRKMHKKWNHVAGEYEAVIAKLHARGIMLYGTFIFGYDDDTFADFERTAAFCRRNGLAIANFNPLVPMPGTALYDRLVAEDGLLLDKWWVDPGFRYGDPIVKTKNMTPQQLRDGPMVARRIFYSWSSIARRAANGLIRWRRPKSVFLMLLSNIISRHEIARKQSRALTPQAQPAYGATLAPIASPTNRETSP